jgi:hypothetical protein
MAMLPSKIATLTASASARVEQEPRYLLQEKDTAGAGWSIGESPNVRDDETTMEQY